MHSTNARTHIRTLARACTYITFPFETPCPRPCALCRPTGGTKAFVERFSLNLRSDLAGRNVRVTNIAPGLCETEFTQVRFRGDTEKASNVYKGTRPMNGDNIADAVVWATSVPAHVNINSIEMMAECQGSDNFKIVKEL